MIKTVTLTTLRIEAIKTQFSYALKLIGKMKMARITLFLREIEAKNIAEISFHGLKPYSYDSDEDIFLSVDWGRHTEYIRRGNSYIETDDTFEDGVAPETIIECYQFNESCARKGLTVEMRVTYADRIIQDSDARDRLNERLGLRPVRADEKIRYSAGRAYRSTVVLSSIQEMSIKRSSN